MTGSKKSVSRRAFLSQTTAALAAGIAAPPDTLMRPAPNDRIIVGVIGVGGRANLLIGQLPDGAGIVAIADCFLKRCEDTAKKWQGHWRIHQDYRKLLDEKDINAVIVGTHDHGRVLPCIHACQAGKDVYAEKPLTVYIGEGRVLVQRRPKAQTGVPGGHATTFDGGQPRGVRIHSQRRPGPDQARRGMNYPGPHAIRAFPNSRSPKVSTGTCGPAKRPIAPITSNCTLAGWAGEIIPAAK